MAITPNLDPTKPIKSAGLFDAAAAGGMSYEDWAKANPTGAMPSIAPTQVNDSMAAQVTALASKDSALNQMARTEGLKAANRRGLLNSSMAVGESQDAVLKNVLPIASQDAQTAANKNAAARAFEYGMAGQVQQQGFQSGEAVAERGWQTAENIAQRGFLGTQADLDRDLQTLLQNNQITSAEKMTYAQIASTEGIEAANRKLSADMQEKDIKFRMSEGNLDRAAAVAAQNADIAFRREQGALDRDVQSQIARWNLSASDRQAASSMVSTNSANYQNAVANINANPNMSKSARSNALTAARNAFNTQMSLTEQMYNVDLSW